MDDEIAKRFEKLEAKVVALEAEIKDTIDGNEYGWMRHYQIHADIERMIYASYFKTHPEFCKSMDQFDAIIGGENNSPDKPKE